VYVLADEARLLSSPTRLFLAVGLLGGFTTFSTFGWGADLLIARGQDATAFVYLVASVGGGLVAVVAGLLIGRGLVGVLRPGALAAGRSGEVLADLARIEAEDRTH